MSDRRPDLRDLLPDDVGADELARLSRIHDLLLQAGPPADLTATLAAGPGTGAGGARGSRVASLAAYRRRTMLLVAAAAAAAVFGIGFGSGFLSRDTGFKAAFGPVPMVGAGPTRDAIAQIWIGPKDAALNWPSLMKVRGLPELGKTGHYALYLTDEKTGKRVLLCSAFAVHRGVTTVTFNFPGPVKGAGWVIVPEQTGKSSAATRAVLWTKPSGTGTA